MPINQLELSYVPEHDRLILRFGTTTDEVIKLFFTRRFIHIFWPVLQQEVSALDNKYIIETTSEQEVSALDNKYIIETTSEDAKNKPSETSAISYNDEYFKLKSGPLSDDEIVLITSFSLNYKNEGITEFSFTGIDGVVVTLNLNQTIIDSLSSLIEQMMPKIKWGINLDELEFQPASEDNRVIH